MTVEELRVVISAEFEGLKNTVKKSKKSLTSLEKVAKTVQAKLQNAFNINTSKMERSFSTINKGTSNLEDSMAGVQGALAQTQAQIAGLGNGFSISGVSLSMGGIKK